MRHSIIIPTINQTRLVQECIASISMFERRSDDYEIIVVDDGSPSNVQNWLAANLRKNSKVKFIGCRDNKGYSHAVNVGISKSSGEYLIVMNNDIKLIKSILPIYASVFKEYSRVGVIGAKLLYPNVQSIQHAGLVRQRLSNEFIHIHKKRTRYDPDANEDRYYVAVTGALFAIRRSAAEDIGPWNENYFLSCEDTEYCLRAWLKGWRVLYAHEIEAIHVEGYTRGTTPKTKIERSKEWYAKERLTAERFREDLKSYDLDSIDRVPAVYNEAIKRRNLSEKDSGPRIFRHVSSFRSPKKKILVRRHAAIGDVILTTPVVRRLRELRGASDVIDVATGCRMVYDGNPYVNNVIHTTASTNEYDEIINLDMCYETDPKKHVIESYLDKAGIGSDFDKHTDLFADDHSNSIVGHFLSLNQFDPSNCIVVHMGRTWANRTWPAEKWKEVLTHLTVACGYQIITVGARNDISIQMDGVCNMFHLLSIQEIAILISVCKCFISNDTGILHVAGTTSTPIVGLYTCAKGEYRLPYRDGGYGGGCALIRPDLPCYGCLHEGPPTSHKICRRRSNECLDKITPKMVVDAVDVTCRS